MVASVRRCPESISQESRPDVFSLPSAPHKFGGVRKVSPCLRVQRNRAKPGGEHKADRVRRQPLRDQALLQRIELISIHRVMDEARHKHSGVRDHETEQSRRKTIYADDVAALPGRCNSAPLHNRCDALRARPDFCLRPART